LVWLKPVLIDDRYTNVTHRHIGFDIAVVLLIWRPSKSSGYGNEPIDWVFQQYKQS